MRYIRISLCGLVVFLVLFSGCGQFSGHDPVGVTGGNESGYGTARSMDAEVDGNGGGQIDANLVGTWIYDDYDMEEIWTFNSNGTFVYSYYWYGELEMYENGTYSATGSQLTIDGDTVTYSINGNMLTMYWNGYSTTYYRE